MADDSAGGSRKLQRRTRPHSAADGPPVPEVAWHTTDRAALETQKHRVVIVGGGFGGLQAARSLKGAPVSVTLIDRRNFHLFQPLLDQVATGSLSPGEIAAPLRSVLSRQKNTRVLLGEVVDIDPMGKHVMLRDSASFEYDSLIVATGSQSFYFGNDQWREWAPSLKSGK